MKAKRIISLLLTMLLAAGIPLYRRRRKRQALHITTTVS